MPGSISSDIFREGLFDGKHVLVSGGTSGIGLAIAEAFLRLGANVLITGTSRQKLAALGTAMTSQKALLDLLDVQDDAAVTGFVTNLPRLDVLVNAAGIALGDDEHGSAGFEKVIDVNLTGMARLSLAARPLLSRQHGSILNIASMYSFFGAAGGPAYAASKGGTVQLTKSLALAYGPEGVRVNAIAPGWIETALTAETQEKDRADGRIMKRLALPRWGLPGDIAEAAVFLSSPAASYITGAVLAIDGGYSSA